MSEVPGQAPGQASGGEPTEEEVREYLAQLREAPVDQVVAEIASGLLNAAQVKLGRPDGRLLIDVVAAITEQLRDRVTDQLTSQLDQALTQLRLAQVEAEREAGDAAAGSSEGPDAPTGGETPAAGRDPGAPGSAGPPGSAGSPSPGQGGSSAASRLWIPGR